MKRKDWKIKNLKEDIYGKTNKITKKRKYIIRERFLFLRKLYLRRYTFLIKKNLVFNYFFYRSFLNYYKKQKQKYIYNIFFKNKKNLKPFLPEFSLSKNVFNSKFRFKSLAKKHNINYIFCANRYNDSNFGLNYYTKDFDKKNFNYINLVKDLNEDENKGLIQFKNFDLEDKFLINNVLNTHFNFNLSILCNLELYKIIIILYINKVIIKYIYVGLNPKQILIDLKIK